MKCVAISDMHGFLEKPENMPQGDVLCICGDIVPLDYQSDTNQSVAWFCLEFVPWTDRLVEERGYKKIILIGGNHDFFLENLHKRITNILEQDGYTEFTWRRPSDVIKRLLPGENKGKHNIIYLCDNSVEIEGKIFYGTPWIADLKRWAFYRDSSLLFDAWSQIPKKCDVLLTHMPPKVAGMGEVIQSGQFNTGEDYGSTILAEMIKSRDIKYALCGHVHSGCHNPQEVDGTTFVNVSIKNENYKPQYFPFEFEI